MKLNSLSIILVSARENDKFPPLEIPSLSHYENIGLMNDCRLKSHDTVYMNLPLIQCILVLFNHLLLKQTGAETSLIYCMLQYYLSFYTHSY